MICTQYDGMELEPLKYMEEWEGLLDEDEVPMEEFGFMTGWLSEEEDGRSNLSEDMDRNLFKLEYGYMMHKEPNSYENYLYHRRFNNS